MDFYRLRKCQSRAKLDTLAFAGKLSDQTVLARLKRLRNLEIFANVGPSLALSQPSNQKPSNQKPLTQKPFQSFQQRFRLVCVYPVAGVFNGFDFRLREEGMD